MIGLQSDIPGISDFRKAALSSIKDVLTSVSNDIDEFKVRDVTEIFISSSLNENRALSSINQSAVEFPYADDIILEEDQDNTQILKLYYDAVGLIFDPYPYELYGSIKLILRPGNIGIVDDFLFSFYLMGIMYCFWSWANDVLTRGRKIQLMTMNDNSKNEIFNYIL